MSSNVQQSRLGEWAFVVGVLLAILLGLFPSLDSQGVSTLFVLLGVIVGFVNITKRETTSFLLASIALLVVGAGGIQEIPALGQSFTQIFFNITSFIAPAVVIVALKAVFHAGIEHHLDHQ